MQYIDNNQQKGIKIDWKMIFKEYKKLKCPEDTYDPTTLPLGIVNWSLLLSARSRGKTTNLLIIGLLLYKHYKIQTGYIRQTDNMTKSTKARELYNVICEFNYIERIFGEEWNSVYLWQKHFYLCKRDDDGNILSKSNDDICMLMSIDKSYDYKSTLTKPRCDWILIDEMISNKYAENEFIDLCQLISTIRRKRLSTKIICASNMVTPYNQYIEEMGLRDTVLKMQPGDSNIVKTILGLQIYVEILDSTKFNDKKSVSANMSYFGFANNKLKAITGEDWEIRMYPHLLRPEEDEVRELITRDIYIHAFGKYLCMEIYNSSVMGDYCLFRPYPTGEPEDGIIFTDQIPKKSNEFYGTGEGTKLHKLWDFIKLHRDFYSSNEIGHMIETYINTVN